jgi:hypothetical protein
MDRQQPRGGPKHRAVSAILLEAKPFARPQNAQQFFQRITSVFQRQTIGADRRPLPALQPRFHPETSEA